MNNQDQDGLGPLSRTREEIQAVKVSVLTEIMIGSGLAIVFTALAWWWGGCHPIDLKPAVTVTNYQAWMERMVRP